ncbi:MAG: Gfo/Idh/MocA family oxidoreductase [Planctomycetes bacterium]|nr:Gfo/Idh/MocA family oxidoreductase [Planctomycetota bacterium]
MLRRNFLRGALAAAASPLVVRSSALGAGRPAPSNRVAVACVGVNNMGGQHLRTLLGTPDAQVVAVCDVDAQVRGAALQAAARAYGSDAFCAGYNDFREILARPAVDALVIAVPDHWHAIISLQALRAGKDVYCEKPMTLTIAQGWTMIETVRRLGRVFQTGTQRRSWSQVRHVCELVRNGRIGRVLRASAGVGLNNRECGPTWEPEPVPPGFDYDLWLGPAPAEPYHHLRCHYAFRFILDYSGGQITNNGAHWTDVVQWAFGKDGTGPLEIEGRAEWPTSGLFTTATDFECTYTYADGAQLTLSPRGGAPRFEGAEGWVSADNKADPPSILSSAIRPDEVRLYDTRGETHMQNFLRCIRTREEPAAPVEVGHRSASVCHLGNIAMMLGRKVKWDPAAERFVNDPEADRLLFRAMRSPWHL